MRVSAANVFLTAMIMLALVACATPAAAPTATASSPAAVSKPGTATVATVPLVASPTRPAASPAVPPAAASPVGPTVKVTTDPKLGNILTDAKGMTLYIYKSDQPNVSSCYGQCAQNWPPLMVAGAPTAPPGFSGTLGTTTRTDGTKQVTYNQMPLYYYAKDTQPGDTTGQGVGGVWYAAQPNSP
jgi:predicted lipoprotein with Yx(FWY)xxD motif